MSDSIGSLFAEALVHLRAERPAEALVVYDRLLGLVPDHGDALNNRGIALVQLGRNAEAEACFARAVASNPGHADAHVSLGICHGRRGEHDRAIACFDHALALRPEHPAARGNRAAAVAARERARSRSVTAPHVVDRLTVADAAFNKGTRLGAAGDIAGAIAAFDAAIAAEPGHAQAHTNRAMALLQCGEAAEALAAAERAIGVRPALAEAHFAAGCALYQLGRAGDAIAAYDAALAAGTDLAVLHANRAIACAAERRFDDALVSYNNAIAAVPNDPALLLHRAKILIDLGQHAAALASLDTALAIDPGNVAALQRRGEALEALKRLEDAIVSFARVAELTSGGAGSLGHLLHLSMHLADWQDFAGRVARIAAAIGEGKPAAPPFCVLSMLDDPELHRRITAQAMAENHPVTVPPPDPQPATRLRIAYVSADFHDHATMYLMADMLESHDRAGFEVTLYSLGLDSNGEMRRRARAAADHFVDATGMSDAAVAADARSRGIDIAVDLKGLTLANRMGIFAARAAPIQVAWLGFPGTTPAAFIDYAIVDPVVVPAAERHHFAESLVYMPGSYQPNCRISAGGAAHARDPERASARAKAGLPESGFVFASFNQVYKITPSVFALWMRILTAVPGSVLWLWADQPTARANLRKAAAAAGIDHERLVFADLLPREAHLERLRCADLFLDTGPYGAHTTASDAFRCGVPVLTRPGRSFASRVATSLVTTLGVPELAVADDEAYVRFAIEVGQDAVAHAALRTRVAAGLVASPLFDPAAFTLAIEKGYRAMQARRLAGEPPADIFVSGTDAA